MSQQPEQPPVRLCCFQRHYGAQCPDGTVMCCLCFQSFPVAMLSVDDSGDPIDVCIPCAADEASANPQATTTPENVECPND